MLFSHELAFSGEPVLLSENAMLLAAPVAHAAEREKKKGTLQVRGILVRWIVFFFFIT